MLLYAVRFNDVTNTHFSNGICVTPQRFTLMYMPLSVYIYCFSLHTVRCACMRTVCLRVWQLLCPCMQATAHESDEKLYRTIFSRLRMCPIQTSCLHTTHYTRTAFLIFFLLFFSSNWMAFNVYHFSFCCCCPKADDGRFVFFFCIGHWMIWFLFTASILFGALRAFFFFLF